MLMPPKSPTPKPTKLPVRARQTEPVSAMVVESSDGVLESKLSLRARRQELAPPRQKHTPSPRPAASSAVPLDIANPAGFVGIPVPHWIASRCDLTPAAKLLYGYLLQRRNDETKVAFPSQRDIGKHIGCSPRWVRELVRELAKGGFIHVARRKLQLRTWKRPSLQTCYSFLKHPAMATAQRTRRRQDQDHIEEAVREQEASGDRKDSSACLRNDGSGDSRVAQED